MEATKDPTRITSSHEFGNPDGITSKEIDVAAQTILDLSAQRVECARSLVELLNQAETEIIKEIKLTEATLAENKRLKDAPPKEGEREGGGEDHICICRDRTCGDMVKCDNSACPLQWFHYECVGLSTQPQGVWFCPYCVAQMRRTDKLIQRK